MKSKSNEKAAAARSGGDFLKEPPLFRRPILADQVPEAGKDISIEANESERAGLAAFDGLAGIPKLEASFHLTHRPRGAMNVKGKLTATIIQTCVVSLEPFETSIEEDIEVNFATPEDLAKAGHEKVMSHDRAKPQGDEEEEDLPDPIIDGEIDLGLLASEFLALALDPYPKKPGVQFEEILTDPAEQESPFAILRKLDKSF